MALQCAVLAGGLGTRMRPLTETVPKALLPVLGAPFADWQLALLAEQGVERVVYCVGYRGELLREHVGDGSRHGLSVTWSDEGQELRGTAGAIRLALDRGALDRWCRREDCWPRASSLVVPLRRNPRPRRELWSPRPAGRRGG